LGKALGTSFIAIVLAVREIVSVLLTIIESEQRGRAKEFIKCSPQIRITLTEWGTRKLKIKG
jgi:hypothetical protein